MDKLDLKKARKELFTASLNRFVLIDVPEVRYLMIDGHGDPNIAPAYPQALSWLYSTAYALKFASKADGKDFAVAPLEGLWWAEDPASFVARRKSEWSWTMMIMVPDFVRDDQFAQARWKAAKKLGSIPESLRLESLREGPSLQALHVGSYDDEGPLLAELHQRIMPEGGYDFAGPHHEIYLGDPRKAAAARLKTILRQPVRPIR